MVLAERNSENVRNGRRSRGPSPNGHTGGSPVSSSDDENFEKGFKKQFQLAASKKLGNKSAKTKTSEYEAEKIRVGRDYQAVCPELIPLPDRKPEIMNDRALLVWSPTKDIPETKLEDYIKVANEKYGYNGEQALGMLFWHKHDLERAVLDLANFTPFPDEWTAEDKVLFEQAFQFHGKSFHRIRQMLPDKSIASLVKYYYSWKKNRNRTSVMDKKEQIKKNEGSENGSENGSNEDSDNEEKKWPIHRGIRRASGSPPRGANDDSNSTSTTTTNQAGNPANAITTSSNTNPENNDTKSNISTNHQQTASTNVQSTSSSVPTGCGGCGVACNYVNNTPQGKLCKSCFHHYRRTGSLRPTSGPCFGKRSKNSGNERHKRKPPRGMHINHDDIVALATDSDQANRNDELLASMDREIVTLWSQIQQNRQLVSSLKRKNSDSLDDLRPIDNSSRISSRWNSEELLLAVQGVKKFGKDFQAIAEAIGTKTEAQIRTFFVNYRRRYNLDTVLKEYETEHAQQADSNIKVNGQKGQQNDEVMAIDLEDDGNSVTNIREKEIELKSTADVSIIPVEKMETETTVVKSSHTSEISIVPCTNNSNKSSTLAK